MFRVEIFPRSRSRHLAGGMVRYVTPSRRHGIRAAGRSGTTLRGRLSAFFAEHQLAPAHRRIADYLAENAPDSIFLSSVGLSAAVGVSQPSTTRFAQALGFAGFAELQEALRALLLAEPRPAAAAPSSEHRFDAALGEAIGTLDQLRVSLSDPRPVVSLGRSLSRSVPLMVLASRSGAPAASHFAYFAARVHPDVRLLTAGGTMTMDSILQGRQAGATWALCFFLPRHPTDLIAAARYAKVLGMRVATITDQASDLVNGFSDIVLPAATGRRLVFPTYAAPMVLSAILVQALCDAEPQRTRTRLREHERMVAQQRLFHTGVRAATD